MAAVNQKKFIADCVRASNEYRSRHGAAALKLNSKLSTIAQGWADHLASTSTMSHNPNATFAGDSLGENVAMKYKGDGSEITGTEMVTQWYNEVKDYNFQSHSGPGTGHFTQLVWKGSKEVGIGRATSKDGKYFLVANYYPAGNFIGRYAENVSPSKDGNAAITPKTRSGGCCNCFRSRQSSSSPDRTSRGTTTPETSQPGGRIQGTTTSSATRTVTKTETVTGPDGSQTKKVTTKTITTKNGVESEQLKIEIVNTNSPTVAATATPPKKSWFGGRSSAASDTSSPSSRADTSGTTAASPTGSQKPKDFIADIIKSHNRYRKLHGKVQDLVHNKELSKVAQTWADRLASTSTLQHSDNKLKGQELGENLASRSGSGQVDYAGSEVVDAWYNEISNYNFASPNERSGNIGHFTQVVWKGSREIGIGKAWSRDRRQVFVVCNYLPAGNVIGSFKDNVLTK